MKRKTSVVVSIILAAVSVLIEHRAGGQSRPAQAPAPTAVVIFDFVTDGEGELGVQLADSIRLKLARNKDQYTVIDQLTTQESSGPTAATAARADVEKLMKQNFFATVGVYGTVSRKGKEVQAVVQCIDLRPGAAAQQWTQTCSDSTERARAVISEAVVARITGAALWTPPQRGSTPEPRNFGPPLNPNGDFEQGGKGWTIGPDNVSTFIEAGPAGRGKVLRMRNDLARDPWLAYRRDLMFGKAVATKPPQIARDTSYGGVAGLEGVDYVSDFFPATPGGRYWLTFDCKGPCSAMVFVKGYKKTDAARDGLPESALKELNVTPEAFAALTDEQRKALIDADARKNPQRYLRECWRWRLTCGKSKDWQHNAEPFPPRGGLPADVEFLQIKILAIWPPGETLWDNVFVYKDPATATTLPEEKPRTPNFGKTGEKE